MTRNRGLSNRGEMTGYRLDSAAPLKSLDFFLLDSNKIRNK